MAMAALCLVLAIVPWWILWRLEDAEGKLVTAGELLVSLHCRIDELRQRLNELESEERMYREQEIIAWAAARNIFGGSTAQQQLKKFFEEAVELGSGVEDRNVDEVKDGIGDVYVCLCIQAHFHGLTMEECIEHAWNEIKDRRGKMVDGIFHKETDAWREAIGCSPVPPGTPLPEERIRKSRDGEPEQEAEHGGHRD